jgi:hypothetical protein
MDKLDKILRCLDNEMVRGAAAGRLAGALGGGGVVASLAAPVDGRVGSMGPALAPACHIAAITAWGWVQQPAVACCEVVRRHRHSMPPRRRAGTGALGQ